MKLVEVITSQLLHRILLTAAVSRLNSRGYSGKRAETFVDAITQEVMSTAFDIQAKCSKAVATAAENGGSEEVLFAVTITSFAEAGIDIADRVIRERVSSN